MEARRCDGSDFVAMLERVRKPSINVLRAAALICMLGQKKKRRKESAPRLFRTVARSIRSENTARAFNDRSGHARRHASADALGAEESTEVLSPQALQEIAQVEAEIDRIEAETTERLTVPPDNQVQQVELLGKLLLYDKQLSVNRNEACAFCHMPETGFTGPVSELNRTTGSYPGSVRSRFSNRKPQSHAYAALAPVLHYNPGQGDLVGGNFWDMRATGRRLGSPAAEQAQGPPTNSVEMGLPDIACAVYRTSRQPYRTFFESVWDRRPSSIRWRNRSPAMRSLPK